MKAERDRTASPLIAAVERNDAALVASLLKEGANPEDVNIHGHTALMVAAEQGSTAVMPLLVAAGADVNAACAWDNHTPLHLAAYYGQEEAAVYLVAFGAKTAPEDKDAMTAAENARIGGHAALEKLLENETELAQRAAAVKRELSANEAAAARAAEAEETRRRRGVTADRQQRLRRLKPGKPGW